MFPTSLLNLARDIIETCTAQDMRIVTAESCTGGLICSSLTEIPGSSAVLERGFISYSNNSKIEVLGVLPVKIEQYGAVSAEVAEAMAFGALEFSRADFALSVTGIAGPTGDTPDKPIGLVYHGIATRKGVLFHSRSHFNGNRSAIRLSAVEEGLKLLRSLVKDEGNYKS